MPGAADSSNTEDEAHPTSPDPLTHTSHSQPDAHHTKLACQACQRKKIRCDRTFPCGQCNRSGLHCVPSARKPRARHVVKRGVDSELRSRIAKLEGLVESLSSEVGVNSGPTVAQAKNDVAEVKTPLPIRPQSLSGGSPASLPQRQVSLDEGSPAAMRYVASDFWATLSNEVQAMKDVLDGEHHESDGEDQPQDDPLSSTAGQSMEGQSPALPGYDLIICPPGLIYVVPGALPEPSPTMALDLGTIFFENVEPIFKVFHAPSIRGFLMRGEPYLDHSPDAPCNNALRACIWFSALITISDQECQQRYGVPRATLLHQYRNMADVMLAQADLVNTNDLATVQGFIIYLATARLVDVSRRVWTLSALLVRIAKAMNLHLDENVGESVFITELKRRFWHQLQVFDAYCAIDRGSEPLLTLTSASRSAPSNVNDSDFDERTIIPLVSRNNQFTDMTFARIVQDATIVVQRLSFIQEDPNANTWEQRQEIANQFSREIEEEHLRFCDPNILFQNFILLVGNAVKASTMLRAVRPMQRHTSSMVPPRVDSPYVLQLAVNSLRCSEQIYNLESGKRWQWLVWVQWHAVAVACAGLCSIRDTALADEAWELLHHAMVRYERHVADTKNGMLWKPIQRLYRRALAFRKSGQKAQSTPSSQDNDLQSPDATIIPEPVVERKSGVESAGGQMWNMSNPAPMTGIFQPPCIEPNTSFPSNVDTSYAFSDQALFNSPHNTSIPRDSSVNMGMMSAAADTSWYDWEKIMKDIDEINVGDMNWMPA